MLLYILLTVILVGFVVTYFLNRNIQQVNKFFNKELQHLDKTYEQFVNQQLLALPKDNFELNIELVKQSTYQHLEPHFLHLLEYINTTTHPNNTLYQCTSRYFPNLISVIEQLFRNKKINTNQRLSAIDKQTFKIAAKEAIEANIDKKLLEIKP